MPKISFQGSMVWTKKSNHKNGVFPQNAFFLFFFKNCLFTFSIKNYLQKIRFVPFMGFPQSLVQLLEKIKKRKKTILRSHNMSVHAKNQVSMLNGMGSR